MNGTFLIPVCWLDLKNSVVWLPACLSRIQTFEGLARKKQYWQWALMSVSTGRVPAPMATVSFVGLRTQISPKLQADRSTGLFSTMPWGRVDWWGRQLFKLWPWLRWLLVMWLWPRCLPPFLTLTIQDCSKKWMTSCVSGIEHSARHAAGASAMAATPLGALCTLTD